MEPHHFRAAGAMCPSLEAPLPLASVAQSNFNLGAAPLEVAEQRHLDRELQVPRLTPLQGMCRWARAKANTVERELFGLPPATQQRRQQGPLLSTRV